MRFLIPGLTLALLVGCSSSSHRNTACAPATYGDPQLACYYAPAASALAFDPPVARYEVPLDLSRDDRGLGAFHGYHQQLTTYYSSFTDDRQSTGCFNGLNSYDRRTFSVEVGTMTR